MTNFNKKIAVVGGGFDGEAVISRRSSKTVMDALTQGGLKPHYIEMDENFLKTINEVKPDVVYNALHGNFGEDGRFQGIMDFLKIPYTGEFYKQSAVCFDKISTKYFFNSHEIATARCFFFRENESVKDELQRLDEDGFRYPMVLKKSQSGSSVGVHLVRNEKEMKKYLDDIFARNELHEYFVEAFLSGKEITVGIAKYKGEVLVLPIIGLTSGNEFYDFDAKYTKGKTAFEIPAVLSPILLKSIEQTCKKIFERMGFRQYVRVDFIVMGKTAFALEINTAPGLTETSDIPMMLKAEGIELFDFFLENLKMASYGKLS